MSGREDHLGETFAALASISLRLSMSLGQDGAFFPVTAASVQSRDGDVLRVLDAFLQRFQQALDQILRKLFPRLQAAVTLSDELLPVRELLENLHRAGVIASIDTWRELIEVRNRLTHDYALDPEERAAVLNEAWARVPDVLAQVDRARSYALRHKLIERTADDA